MYSFVVKNAQGTAEQVYSLDEATGAIISDPVLSANLTYLGSSAIACYCPGTLIATAQGERPVESLAIGDTLVTASGAHRPIRWIGRRSYAGRFLAANPAIQPIRFRAGSLGGGLPHRDLLVSPEHAMFIDGVLVPARCLVDGDAIAQERGWDRVDYVHIELDSHDVILAEGAASESFVDDGSRGMFHNAAEYRALYPHAGRPAARYCAPRVEDGEALAALRARLAARTAPAPSPLLGQIDGAEPTRIHGWAYDPAQPDEPVILRIAVDGVARDIATADHHRPDLQQAGHGHGRHGFSVSIPGGLAPDLPHVVSVTRLNDGQALANSPWTIPVSLRAPQPAPAPAAALRGRLDGSDRQRAWGWAWDPAAPHAPVALQVLDNGVLVGRVVANSHRADLAAAGIGAGWHSFDLRFPTSLSPLGRHVLELRRESDGAAIPGEPVVIEPVDSFDATLQQAVANAVTALDGGDDQRVLSFMLAQADRLLQRRADAEARPAERRAQQQFRRRWGADTAPDAAPARRALVIDERHPAAGRDAGSQAMLSHMRALQALGYQVSLVAADEMQAAPEAAAALADTGVTCCGAPFYASVEDVLRRQAGGFDVVYLHRAGIAARYLNLARFHQPQARLLYSVADLHHVRLARQAALAGNEALHQQALQMRRTECAAAMAADTVITHSEPEAALLRQLVPQADVRCIGWDVPVRRPMVAFRQRRGVAFIGAYRHAPNLDAAVWLAEAVMPLVWQADPAIPCTLVGSDMPEWLHRLAGPGLEVAGQVAGLGPAVFDRVRLTVAPLRFGAGLKGKVLDSLAAGVPCAMTPVAAEGLALPPALQALVGQDAAALAAVILRLHGSTTLNREAGRAGQDLVRQGYTAEAVTEAIRGAVEGQKAEGLDDAERCVGS